MIFVMKRPMSILEISRIQRDLTQRYLDESDWGLPWEVRRKMIIDSATSQEDSNYIYDKLSRIREIVENIS